MIPVTADQRLTVPTKDGKAKLFLRYLVGPRQDEFLSLQAMQASGKSTAGDRVSAVRRTVNLFVAGWEGAGWPPYPADEKPGELFKFGDLSEISTLIAEHLHELTGITPDEAKN